MALRIDQNINGNWVPIYLKEFSNAPGVWVNHRGEEIGLVKKGEQLRFNYVSIKGSTQSIGNFLDNAAFGVLDFTEPGLPELPGNPDTGGQVPGQPEQPYNPSSNSSVPAGCCRGSSTLCARGVRFYRRTRSLMLLLRIPKPSWIRRL